MNISYEDLKQIVRYCGGDSSRIETYFKEVNIPRSLQDLFVGNECVSIKFENINNEYLRNFIYEKFDFIKTSKISVRDIVNEFISNNKDKYIIPDEYMDEYNFDLIISEMNFIYPVMISYLIENKIKEISINYLVGDKYKNLKFTDLIK